MNGNKFMYNGKPQKWQGEQRSFGAHKLVILWYITHTTESTGPNISILVNIYRFIFVYNITVNGLYSGVKQYKNA